MTIEKHMNLGYLQEHMGADASEAEAEAMRDLLVERYNGAYLEVGEVPEAEWAGMIADAVKLARA